MAGVQNIPLLNKQVGVEIEEGINAKDIIKVEVHNMCVKDALVDYIIIICSLSLLDSDSSSFSDSYNPDPTSFSHTSNPWRLYMLNLPYTPNYDGPRPPSMSTLRQDARTPRMFIGSLLNHDVTTSIFIHLSIIVLVMIQLLELLLLICMIWILSPYLF